MINKIEKLIQEYKKETDNMTKISILVSIKNELDINYLLNLTSKLKDMGY